jgi:hypothetical protein
MARTARKQGQSVSDSPHIYDKVEWRADLGADDPPIEHYV